MNVVIENQPSAVSFASLNVGDYFVTWSGDLFRKKSVDTAHRVTASWPMAAPTLFDGYDPVHRVEITAIHVKVVN